MFLSGNPWSDYIVTAASDRTLGSITPANKNGLQWGTGKHYFHASYPAEGVSFGPLTNTTRTFTATIPSEQGGSWNSSRTEYRPDMNHACMYAVAMSEDETPRTKVSLDLGSGIQLSKTQARSFTLFALPMTQEKLTLILTFSNGTTRRLELKENGKWLRFPACSKVFIDNMGVPNLLNATVFIDGQKLQRYEGEYFFPKFDFTPSKDSILVWRGEQASFSVYSSAKPAPEYKYEWSTDETNWHDRSVTDLPYTSTVSSDGRSFSTTPTERGVIYVRITGTRGSGANEVTKEKVVKIRTRQLISLALDPASQSSAPIEIMVAPNPGNAFRGLCRGCEILLHFLKLQWPDR